MFAQLYVHGKAKDIKMPFAVSTEKPIFKGFIISIIAGTVLGGYLTALWLMHSMAPATLANAIAAGAAVGASAGLLFFGLADVIVGGRLEENAELVEKEEEFDLKHTAEDKQEEAGREDFAFALPKAS